MKKLAKGILCMVLATVLVTSNYSYADAANDSMTYSELMEEEKVEKGAADNVDVEAEEIFGSEKATTTIDSSTKKSNTETKQNNSKQSVKNETVKEVPKTGMEDTPVYLPILLLVFAVGAAVCAGVKFVGAKRIKN